MEITVNLRRLNYKYKTTSKIIAYMLSEGWRVSLITKKMFVTYYSFSKII